MKYSHTGSKLLLNIKVLNILLFSSFRQAKNNYSAASGKLREKESGAEFVKQMVVDRGRCFTNKTF